MVSFMGGNTVVSRVLPSRTPALASKNKCLIIAFFDPPVYLKDVLTLSPRLFQNKTITQERTHRLSFLFDLSGSYKCFQLPLWDS